MAKKLGLAIIALIVAAIALNKDKLLTKLRQEGLIPAVATDKSPAAEKKAMTLPAARKALVTTISGQDDTTPAPEPPAGDLEKVSYDAPLGKNVAYVTPVKPGPRRPAILWIHGGFSWGIDDGEWTPGPRDNDQSAVAFRKAGIAEMYPALRGANQNPGHPECFLGEIDDVLAAAEFLARRPDVDPQRIYIGGHSTGAVMALLAAESTPRFRAVFAFGPVADVRQYGPSGCLPTGVSTAESKPRAPVEFLSEIVTPTFIIEGEQGNAVVFPMMRQRVGSAPVTFVTIPHATHFNALAAACDVVAKAILGDTGAQPAIKITVAAIEAARGEH